MPKPPIKNCQNCMWRKPNGPFPHMLIDCIRYPQTISKPNPSICGEYKQGDPFYLEAEEELPNMKRFASLL